MNFHPPFLWGNRTNGCEVNYFRYVYLWCFHVVIVFSYAVNKSSRMRLYISWLVKRMPANCCVVGCTNRCGKDKKVKFFRFPRDQVKRDLWKAAVHHEGWEPSKHLQICSAHFISGMCIFLLLYKFCSI